MRKSLVASLGDLVHRLGSGFFVAVGGVLGLVVFALTALDVASLLWNAVLFVTSYIALFWAYHGVRAERDGLRQQLEEIKVSAPRIECLSSRGAELQSAQHKFYAIQARFKNSPKVRTDRAVARKVSATIEFWDSSRTEKRLEIFGQWALSEAPDHVGSVGVSDTVDFEANELPRKLYVALRPPDSGTSFAYAKENLHAYPDGRHPKYELIYGTYRVCVKLRSSNVEQDFWFTLNNPGGDTPLDLEFFRA